MRRIACAAMIVMITGSIPAAAAWRHCGRYMTDPNGVGISVDVPSWASAQDKDTDPTTPFGRSTVSATRTRGMSPSAVLSLRGEVTPKCYAVFVEAYGQATADCLAKPGKSTPRCVAALEKLKGLQ